MRKITSLDGPGMEVFTRLNEPQLYHYSEPAPGLFIAETPNVIRRALEAGYRPVTMLCEESLAGTADEILEGYPDMPVCACPLPVLKQLTGYTLTHGMLCSMRRIPVPGAGEILRQAMAEDGCAGRIAVLEEVENPTNVGAIFRSAAAMGIGAVLLTKGCADPLQRRCSRVSMGCVFQIPWTYLPEDWIAFLHNEGYRVAAMALEEESIPVSDPVLKQEERLALVLGSEGYGLKRVTIARSDHIVRIPMRSGVDSLNVAAAAAVAFWEVRKPAFV